MKEIRWNLLKSERLKRTRGVSFEEIIKAMVKTGLGIGIVPYQSVEREVRARQFFCSRIEGWELVRETGWAYTRANRTPRMILELLRAFDGVRGKLHLTPSRGVAPTA